MFRLVHSAVAFWIAIGCTILLSAALFGFVYSQQEDKAVHANPTSPTQVANPREIPANIRKDVGIKQTSGLPLPSSLSVPAYEALLFDFLNQRRYVQLGWKRDKWVRDTGPYINGVYYGTHPAVRVYYSPEVVHWLESGRLEKVPDGAMVIKEQFEAPAIRHQGKPDEAVWDSLKSWAVMVKDSAGSHDGWFWSNPGKNQTVVDNNQYGFGYPISGFGQYCIRCHASTESPGIASPADKANEFLFAALRNIEGYNGSPIVFRVDDSWRPKKILSTHLKSKTGLSGQSGELVSEENLGTHPRCTALGACQRDETVINQPFIEFFTSIKPTDLKKIVMLPPETHDWGFKQPNASDDFLTANQCMNCHAGLVAPFGSSMFLPTGSSANYGDPGWHVSPYGEWRWTPMGLAGRDPIFYAQLDSELAMIEKELSQNADRSEAMSATLVDTCLRCHGVMGKREHDRLRESPDDKFALNDVYAISNADQPMGHGQPRLGALARDGISCAVCHRMQAPVQPSDDARSYLEFLMDSTHTGNFVVGPPTEMYGPFKDDEMAPYVMEHALGIKPKYNPFMKSSQLCASCHTVVLPIVDRPLLTGSAPDKLAASDSVPMFREFQHHIEQATYLEWLNSAYQNEINPIKNSAKTCQDCHMSRGLRDDRHNIDIQPIQTRMAAVQDSTYPEAENLTRAENLNIRIREEGYARHNFSGLNAYLVEMFNQFDDVLGVRKQDFMTGSTIDLENSIENILQLAGRETAEIKVTSHATTKNQVSAHVKVTNKAGHRFPSGVGFRRAFIELLVVEKTVGDTSGANGERILWSSGRTNSLGILIGSEGNPLPTEFFEYDPTTTRQSYQPHHQVITSPNQVQIFETLLRDAKGRFTTSFIRGGEIVKDNRLLPLGWSRTGPGSELSGHYLAATQPGPLASADPQYQDGSGTDSIEYRIVLAEDADPSRVEIRATLYYQAIPPYFLRSLFDSAPNSPAVQRLYYICSRIDFSDTPLRDWKLKVVSDSATISRDE